MAAALTIGAAYADEFALQRARALYGQLRDHNQCEAALPAARSFWASSDFGTLQNDVRARFLYEVMRCAWSLQDGPGAIAAGIEARRAGATWADFALLRLGVRFEDHALAVEAFHALSLSAPKTFRELESRYIWGALRAAARTDSSGAAELRIHELLVALGYAFPENLPDDSLRVEHARLLAGRGDWDRARARLAAVIDPREVMVLRVDRAFAPLRADAAFAARLDVAAAAEASLARARETAARDPRKLAGVLDLAQALRALGRDEEALAELDRAIAAAQAEDGASRFDDVRDYLNWLLNERGYVLYDLNRPEEARQAFGLSIAVGESGQWSVSQVINFATMLQSEGRAADALEVVQTVGDASPYGLMWVAAVRACAAEQLNNAALRAEALAYLREHEDDNVSARTRALLCVNDLDGAAALYVRRLGDPLHRESALLALQNYRRPHRPALPRDDILHGRVDQVRLRPEVQAAVAAVGHIEDVPLQSVYWGDI
jgi:hypothetical protein